MRKSKLEHAKQRRHQGLNTVSMQLDCLTGIHQPSMQYSVQTDMFKKSKEKPSSVFDKTKTAKFRENKGFVHSGPAPYFLNLERLVSFDGDLSTSLYLNQLNIKRKGNQLFQSQYITPKTMYKIKHAITAISDRPSFSLQRAMGFERQQLVVHDFSRS